MDKQEALDILIHNGIITLDRMWDDLKDGADTSLQKEYDELKEALEVLKWRVI